MANLYTNPSLQPVGPSPDGGGYTTYKQPDTRVPPKALPVMREIAVNGIAIPENDILAEAQNHPADNPGGALRAAAEALVVRELLRQEAARLGIAAEAQDDAQGRRETAADAAIQALIDREVPAPSAIKQECKRYYDLHLEKFRSEPLFEARHILLAAPESDKKLRAAMRERATGLCTQLADHPERFSELARQHSDCPSREQGGNLGQLGRGSTVAEFEAAMMAMREAAISATPVESRFGFHVIALDRKIEGRQLPFDMVADRIAAWLEASAWSKAVSQYIAVLAGQAKIAGIALDGADGPLLQ
jgi:peptidyl-prolyl cis-trans isomerase C